MTYDDLKLSDRQILDVLARRPRASGALVMVHAENADCIGWLTERLELAGQDRAEIPRRRPPAGGRARGDAPRDRARRAGRRADPDRPRLGRARRSSRSAGRAAAACTSTPRPARSTCSSPPTTSTRRASRAPSASAARRRATGRARRAIWDGLRRRAVPGVLVRPRAVPLRRPAGQDSQAATTRALPPRPERHPGARDAAAAAVLGGRATAAGIDAAPASWR